MDHVEVVFDVVLPSVHEAAEVVHPCEEAFDLPSSSVAAKGAAILCFGAIAAVQRDHFDSIFVSRFSVQSVRIEGLVADQPGREFVEAAGSDSEDLRALPAAGGADGEAPFLALAKVAARTSHPG